MSKILLVLSLPFLLYAKVIEFKESRFIDALQNSVVKYGEIEIKENFLQISYKNNLSLLLENDKLYMIKDDEKKQIDDKYKKIYMNMLRSLIIDEDNNSNELFDKEKNGGVKSMKPKGDLSNFIEKIMIKKEEGILIYLKIELSNKDRITIEQI